MQENSREEGTKKKEKKQESRKDKKARKMQTRDIDNENRAQQ